MLGVVIPGVMTSFDKAVVGGIAASADGEWTLMTAGFEGNLIFCRGWLLR